MAREADARILPLTLEGSGGRAGDVEAGGDEDRRPLLTRLLMTLGPGLMVCLADTDGSCLITAADSGSTWRYQLLALQAVLVPILYCAQELTVRLASATGKGMTAMIRDEAGPKVAWLVTGTLLLDCALALVSEVNVIGQTMLACWGVPLAVTGTLFGGLMVLLALTGQYWVAEKVGLAMGILQVFFFVTMFMARPDGAEILDDLVRFPVNKPSYVKLVTSNIGAVIMPWMLAYQQRALCEKSAEAGGHHRAGGGSLMLERIDTAVGSVLTQGVMAAMLITVAAAPQYTGQSIETVDQLLEIFTYVMGGQLRAKIALTFAVCGACIVAAIVVSLCGAWALEEALGHGAAAQEGGAPEGLGTFRQMSRNVHQRPAFYTAYIGTVLVAWVISVATPDFANKLTGATLQFINGILMPPVVFALWYLAAYKLPAQYRLGCFNKWMQFTFYFICSAFCLLSIPDAFSDGDS